MTILKGYEIPDSFIKHEKLIQEVANAKEFDKEKFISLYSNPKILYDSSDVSPEFYNIEQNTEQTKDRIDAVINILSVGKDASIISVGCGKEMNTLKKLKMLGYRNLFGTDILDEDMLDEHKGIVYMKADKCIGTYAAVICMETLEHISTNNTMKFWKMLYDKFDSEIILTIPHTPSLENVIIRCPLCNKWTTESGHVRYYPPSVVIAEAKANGINIVQYEKYSGENWIYRGIKS